MKRYNAIILGCGRIAGGYDQPGDQTILTHAHAITTTSQINLAGLYDTSQLTAKRMADKWQTKAYSSIEEIFEKIRPDIVTVAVPAEFHEEILETLQQFSPQIIICEKPLGKDLPKLKDILEHYKKRKIKLAVNFSRNYDPRIAQLKQEIERGTFGEFLNGVCFYSKGLRHNGSHAISLLRFLLGDVQDFKILGSRIDYKTEDPSIELQLKFKSGARCYLLTGDESKYSIFEWQFLFSKSRITFKNDGFLVCTQEVTDDPLFPGYKTLGEEKCEETGLKKSMSTLYENVLKYLESDQSLLCTAEDAFTTQVEIEKIFDKFNRKKNC